MPFCKRCGVEISQKLNKCPLCRGNLSDKIEWDENKMFPDEDQIEKEIDYRYKKDIKILWSILTLIFSVSIFIFLIIFLKFPKSKSWIFYPILSILALFNLITISFFLYKKTILFFLLSFLNILLFLFLLDILDGKIVWFFKLGLPILLNLHILGGILFIIIKNLKKKSFNIFGVLFLLISIFCIILDIIINFYSYNNLDFIWSPFVAAILIPISIYFFYLQYIAKKDLDIDRFFHID